MIGIALMGSTRLTGRLYPRWKQKYYLYSAIARPIGIISISWAWVEIFSAKLPFEIPSILEAIGIFVVFFFMAFILCESFLRRLILPILICDFVTQIFSLDEGRLPFDILPVTMLVLMAGFSFYSIVSLGVRKSFFFARMDDQLVKSGLYKYYRHPQLLFAIMTAAFSIAVFAKDSDENIFSFEGLNLIILTAGFILISRIEDRDLLARFGESYSEFKAQVPGYFAFLRKVPVMRWKFAFVLAFVATIFSSCMTHFIAHSTNPANFIFGRRDYMNNIHGTYVIKRGMDEIGRNILKSKTDDGFGPNTEVPEILSQYLSFFTPTCSSAIYYCNKRIFSLGESEALKLKSRKYGLPAIPELSFPLVCNKDKVELAMLYTCSDDEFADAYLTIVDGNTVKTIRAAYSSTKQYSDEIQKRIKAK